MTRLLVLVALALFVAYLLSQGLARLRERLDQLLGAASPRTPAPRRSSAGELVSCASCGVHVLRSRALPARRGAAAASFYCGEACRSRAGSAA